MTTLILLFGFSVVALLLACAMLVCAYAWNIWQRCKVIRDNVAYVAELRRRQWKSMDQNPTPTKGDSDPNVLHFPTPPGAA